MNSCISMATLNGVILMTATAIEGIQSFSDFGIDGGELFSLPPRRLYLIAKNPNYSLDRRHCGAHVPVLRQLNLESHSACKVVTVMTELRCSILI